MDRLSPPLDIQVFLGLTLYALGKVFHLDVTLNVFAQLNEVFIERDIFFHLS
jgi:hypothetical protein